MDVLAMQRCVLTRVNLDAACRLFTYYFKFLERWTLTSPGMKSPAAVLEIYLEKKTKIKGLVDELISNTFFTELEYMWISSGWINR